MADGTPAPAGVSRLDWIWLALPYPLLIVSTILAWTAGDLTPAELPVALVAGAVLAAWHTWWTVGHQHWLERTLAPMVVYFAGYLALTATLFHLSFSYFPVYLMCYPLAFVALPGRWTYPALVLTAAVSLAVPGLLNLTVQNVLVTVAATVLAGAAGWSIRALEQQTNARHAALAELAHTHTDLERAHTELEKALAENLALGDRLVSEAHESGIATERNRLAAEIHDTLAAALTGIVSQLEALDAELPPQDPMRRRVRSSTEMARESLQEARRSIHALRPTALAGRSLARALEQILAGFEHTHGVAARLHVTGTPTGLPDGVEDTVVRIAREALTNVERHAVAKQVYLTLSYLGDAIALDIADDGAGFDAAQERPGGHGLRIMSDRAQAAGGQFEVRTEAGAGTTLTVTLPLPAPPGPPFASHIAPEHADGPH